MIGHGHEDNMTEREVIPHLPTSSQIIGALISRLGIRHPNLQDRTAVVADRHLSGIYMGSRRI